MTDAHLGPRPVFNRLLAATCMFGLAIQWNVMTVAQDDAKTRINRNADSNGSAENSRNTKEPFAVTPDVEAALVPLFSSILKADGSRTTIRLSAETTMNGVVVETQESTYQIASRDPNQYTIYYKSDDGRRRLYSDGEVSVVALDTDAFCRLPPAALCQDLMEDLPVNLGTYPEPILALSLAGVDPAFTFLSGMRSVESLGPTKFRGRTDSIRLRGVQNDGVTWDFWMTADDNPKPLRLLVDLTPMLLATRQVAVPEGYGHSLRYDFLSWRVTGDIDESLFRYAAPDDAREYANVDQYARVVAGRRVEHPLLGQPAPDFELTMLDGSKLSSQDLRGRVVVLDFWSTWCGPCLKAMPVIEAACAKHPAEEVQFVAVNVGEFPAHVRGFTSELKWKMPIALDPKGDLAMLFAAKKIPLTLILSPDGIVEAAHVGFPGADELSQQFADEFDILLQGGTIASSR